MAVNRAALPRLLLPALAKVRGKYDDQPKQWSTIFKKKTSRMAQEQSATMRYLGTAQLKAEGASTTFDNNAGQRFIYNSKMIAVSIGYAITREAVDDNLYKSEFEAQNLGLQKSHANTKEVFGADILNTGQVYNANIGGDGVALFSTSHPYDGGLIANTPTVQVDLNESSLLNAMTSIPVNFVDQAGLKNNIKARRLVVPTALEPVAIRLTKTALRPGTNDNDVNAIMFTQGGLPDGYVTNNYLTSNFAWFLLTNVEGLMYYEREGFDMTTWVDEYTQNLLVSGYERYAFSYEDPLAAYGSFPTM